MRPPRSPLDPDLDARLVARCRAGEARAWAALVRRYERLVYAVARGYRLAPEDVADVFQEVFAALVRGLPRLRDGRSLCRWLSSTTERIALATALRRRRERARDAGPAADHADRGPAAEPAGAELDQLEGQLRVRLALASLGGPCRALIEALYYRDPAPAYREVAALLGIPIGSIGPTRARCLEKLERALKSLEDEPARISTEAPLTSGPEDGGRRRPRARAPEESAPSSRTEEHPHGP